MWEETIFSMSKKCLIIKTTILSNSKQKFQLQASTSQ